MATAAGEVTVVTLRLPFQPAPAKFRVAVMVHAQDHRRLLAAALLDTLEQIAPFERAPRESPGLHRRPLTKVPTSALLPSAAPWENAIGRRDHACASTAFQGRTAGS